MTKKVCKEINASLKSFRKEARLVIKMFDDKGLLKPEWQKRFSKTRNVNNGNMGTCSLENLVSIFKPKEKVKTDESGRSYTYFEPGADRSVLQSALRTI